eukprot:7585715-Ditylum_brightwellii.AAC.1
MEEHKDGNGSSGSEKSASSSNISNDVKKDTTEKIKVKEGKKRKSTGRKPSSVPSLQGRRTAVKKKMTKVKMRDKGTPHKEKKTSSVDDNTTKEDEKRNVFQKGSSDNISSPGNQIVVRKKKNIFKNGGKYSNQRKEYIICFGWKKMKKIKTFKK